MTTAPEPIEAPSDLTRALAMCAALSPQSDGMTYLVLPGDPYSKSRPRFSRNGKTYVKKEDRDHEQLTGLRFRQVFKQPKTGNVALGCIFFRPNRQRIDADNMLKHVCDAANGIVYLDDSQVTAVLGIVELDAENPRTVVMVADHVSTLTRGTDAMVPCEFCREPMVVVGKNKARRYCGKACTYKARGHDLSVLVPCRQCSKPFRRTTVAQKMCSPECRADSVRGRNKARAQPRSECTECGKKLAHTRGGRCRNCWRAAPLKATS
ncbi:RusA family crossover junction endodeoxyribonuclease [Streptomyces anulatus]|uniref:RusA family crossover junction endodeoxyribonuclease n=1 Tax=Streptomyces anulatus TaxID=1892 RepID=UPI0022576B6E|nr:RusA family crossover junction endodeoxyribonuclease [Streptomyces anulatus]MCX4606900.1 RusA family crossover junction endodeoxyribonuclease [Streptomyces anulatus]